MPAARDRAWITRHLFWVVLAILGAAGACLVLLNTRLGAYTSDDTYYYIYPARDLLAGKGFHPSYIFAPLFPLALAGLGLLGLDALEAARWLNALLFGVNIFLVGRLARRMSLSEGFSLLAALLVLLSDVLTEAHGWAMSEALSFTFMLLSLDFTLAYLARPTRRMWWAAALTGALTILTRYAALPLAVATAFTVLVYAPGRPLNRLKRALLFGAASLAPIAAYWLRNQLTSGQPVRYQRYFFVPFTRDQLDWFLYHWLSLFVPGRFLRGREIAAGLVFLVIAVAAALLIYHAYRSQWTRVDRSRLNPGLFLLSAVIGANLLMLFFARGLTELDVFNPRYLTPLLLLFLLLLTALADLVWQVAGTRARLAVVALAGVFLIYYAYRTVDFSRQMQQIGLGYSNIGWHNSETVAYLRQHPELTEDQLVSTGEMGIYFWTGRKPKVISELPDPQAMKEYLCQHEATLFVMNQMPTDIYGLEHDWIVQELELAQEFNDSEMYRCPQGR